MGRLQIWSFHPTDAALDVIVAFDPDAAQVTYNCGAGLAHVESRRPPRPEAIGRQVI